MEVPPDGGGRSRCPSEIDARPVWGTATARALQRRIPSAPGTDRPPASAVPSVARARRRPSSIPAAVGRGGSVASRRGHLCSTPRLARRWSRCDPTVHLVPAWTGNDVAPWQREPLSGPRALRGARPWRPRRGLSRPAQRRRLRGQAPLGAHVRRARPPSPRSGGRLRCSRACDHPGVAAVHEVGQVRDRPYLVMELVGGRTLADAMAGGLSEARAVTIAADVAEALGAAHAAGLTHRDVKPQNIMIQPDGSAKLIDFGLAARAPAVRAADDCRGRHLRLQRARADRHARPHRSTAAPTCTPSALSSSTASPARLPFQTTDVGELLRQHTVEPAPDVRTAAPRAVRAACGAHREAPGQGPRRPLPDRARTRRRPARARRRHPAHGRRPRQARPTEWTPR